MSDLVEFVETITDLPEWQRHLLEQVAAVPVAPRRLVWVPKLTDPTRPTSDEINAGVDLGMSEDGIEGLSP